MMTWWKKWWNFYLVIYQISKKWLPTLVLNVETLHYLSEISKSREKRILKMLWKCQIFPLRVPVVIEMCCCVGKCPVGSQKTILSYAPIEDRECHCHFLVWMLSLIRKRWDLHYHWPLVINSIFSHLTYLYVIFSNTFASFLGIFQYSLIVMSRVDFFSSQTLLMSYVVE